MMPTASSPRAGRVPAGCPTLGGDSSGTVHPRAGGLFRPWKEGFRAILLLALLAIGLPPLRAAESGTTPRVWTTQTFQLKTGWSSIFSHVDAGDVTLTSLAASNLDIDEIWQWDPDISSLQFLESPDQPSQSPGNWLVWRRNGVNNTLGHFAANAAYLVKLRAGATQFQWTVKGSPVPVFYNWTSDGMNLVGFSTSFQSPPTLESFLTPVPRLLLNTPIYQYRGGDLGPANPLQVVTPRTTLVRRGEAFWVRAGDISRYYGPFELQLQDQRGVHFGDRLSRYQLTLRNLAAQDLTVNAAVLSSEVVPLGGEALAPVTPTLLIRGDLKPDSLTHAYQTLSASSPRSWVLKAAGQPGSELTLILGIDWGLLQGEAGKLNGGILRFTDAAGQVQYDLPLTARVPDESGLWVGEATVTHVQEDLKSFRKSSDQGTVKVRETGDITLTWVKRLPEGGTPSDAVDTSKWLVIDGLFFRKFNRTYSAVTSGDELLPPDTDENGQPMANPGFYWQARPLDPAFAAGYYFDEAQQLPIANGYRNAVTLVWEKAAGVNNPANATYPTFQTNVYEPLLEGTVLAAPSNAVVNVSPAFWNPRPDQAPDRPPFEIEADTQVLISRVTGDLSVVWLTSASLETPPSDASDSSKWFVSGGRYYRKVTQPYSGVVEGLVLEPPTTNELGQDLGGDLTYYQTRPYHPSYVAGYDYDPGTGKAVANGLQNSIQVLWLRAANANPALGESRSYSNVVADLVLAPPDRTRNAVAAAHWKPRPVGATSQPAFEFTPTGESYETTSDGRYVQTSESRNMAKAAKAMPLRLIFHSAPTGGGQYAVKLLQRVYFATDGAGKVVLANDPQQISSNTTPIRRISTVQVPWTEDNQPVACTGTLRFGVAGELVMSYADGIANPFVHAYHPDHDNLDARYEQPVAAGVESYGIRRAFNLTPAASTPDFESLTRGGDSYPGVYEERIVLEGENGFAKEYHIRGGYLLRRIVSNPTLLVQ
jgi:hypothetical protein